MSASIGGTLEQMFQETRRLRAILDLIERASRVTGREALEQICSATNEIVGSDVASIIVWSVRRRRWVVAASAGENLVPFGDNTFDPRAVPFYAEIAEGRPVVLKQDCEWRQWRKMLAEAGVRAHVIVPMGGGAKGQLSGTLSVNFCGSEFVPEQYLLSLQLIANHTRSLVIQNLNYRRIRISAEWRWELARLIGTISTLESSASVIPAVAGHLANLFPASAVAYLVPVANPGQHLTLNCEARAGAEITGLSAEQVSFEVPTESILARAALQALPSFQTIYGKLDLPIGIEALKNVMILPVLSTQGARGLLLVADREDLCRFDKQVTHELSPLGAFVGVMIDRCLARERAENLAAELDRNNQLKSDFVSAVAHDLRTPLTVLGGYSDIIAEQAFGEIGAKYCTVAQRMRRSVAEMEELVSSCLDISRLEAGREPVVCGDVEVEELAYEVEAETSSRVQEGVAFKLELDPALGVAYTDAVKLKMILRNLTGNALKFTSAGHVVLSGRRIDGGHLEFRVTDTGRGMTPEQMSKIWNSFYRVSKDVPGLGLGLAIVKRLVDLLGADIKVESQLGLGTTFTLQLAEGERPGTQPAKVPS